MLANCQGSFFTDRLVRSAQLVGAGAEEAALLVRGKVHMVRGKVVIDDDSSILLEILLDTLFLHKISQFGRSNIFPTPGQIREDHLRQGQHDLVRAVAGFAVATAEGSQ